MDRLLLRGLLAGAVAGAAGTTALNAITYADMALRGRPPSRTAEQSVERIARTVHLRVPGPPGRRTHRTTGLGALLGMATGTGLGALAGAVRASGVRLPYPLGAAATAGLAMLAANGPMTALKVTDPRRWTPADWASDVVPHAGYGAVVSAALRLLLP